MASAAAGCQCRAPCSTTPLKQPTWCLHGPRPLLRIPVRRLSVTLECQLPTCSKGNFQKLVALTPVVSQVVVLLAAQPMLLLHLILLRAALTPSSALGGHSGKPLQEQRLQVIGQDLMSGTPSVHFAAQSGQSDCVSCAKCI